MTVFQGVNETSYIRQSVSQMRELFQPWSARMLRMYMMVQPQAGQASDGGWGQAAYGGGSVSSALMGSRTPTRLEQSQSRMTHYVSSHMAMIHQNFVGRATRFPPMVKAAVLATDAEQATRQQWLVDWLSGVFYMLDAQAQEQVLGTSWTRRVIDYASTPGKIIGMPHVRETFPGSGQATVDFTLYDPLTCYHDIGDTWPWRFVREYVTNADSARFAIEDMGLPVPKSLESLNGEAPAVLSEYWVAERIPKSASHRITRAIMVNGSLDDEGKSELAGEPWETKFTHFPGIIQASHATTSTWRQPTQTQLPASQSSVPYNRGVTTDAILYHSQPFYAALEQTHNQEQLFMSELYEGIIKNLNPSTVFTDADGTFMLGPEEQGPGSRNAVSANRQEKIEYLVNQAMAGVEAAARLFMDSNEKQFDRLYNPALFGANDGAAGYAINIGVSHSEAILQEPTMAAAGFMTRGAKEIAHQFKQSKLKFTMKGKVNGGFSGEHYFLRDFKASDFPDQCILDVEVRTDVPQDQMGALQFVIAGTKNGAFSMKEGRANSLNIKDPDRTQDLIDLEQTASLPVVKNIKILAKAREEIGAMFLKAQNETEPKERMAALREANVAQAQYEQMEQQLLGQVQSQSQPQGDSQPSPNVMPPEAGLNNPDQNARARGKVSSALGGQGAVGVTGQGGGGPLTPGGA